jgi:hypothetical protein
MRQVIKGDGSDGTAAAKAYLLAHDSLLSQELYEFQQAAIGFPVAARGGLPMSPCTQPTTPSITEDFGEVWNGVENITVLFGEGSAVVLGDGTNVISSGKGISRSLSGFFVPDVFLTAPIGLYGVPGSDNPLARPRSDIARIFAVATLDVISEGNVPLCHFQVSPNAGADWGGIMPGHPNEVGHWQVRLDITNFITSHVAIADLDFNQVYFGMGCASSTDWGDFDSPAGGGIIAHNVGLDFEYSTGGPEPPPSPRKFFFTDSNSPLTYASLKYAPTTIKNDGFKSKIGLDVDSLKLTWTLRGDEALVTDPNTAATILTILQGFQYGLLEGYWVKWRRAIMPTFGDCDSIGAVSMFRGRIAEVEVDRLTAKITVNSVTDLFNRQIPQQLIEANNRSMQVGPGLPPDLDPSPTHWAVMVCEASEGGTVTKIVARQTQPTADEVYAPGTFDMGYLWFQASPFENLIAQVRHYEVISGFNVFYLFRPLYIDPHVYAAKFIAFVPVPKDQNVSGSSLVELKGFPWVPLPEQAV